MERFFYLDTKTERSKQMVKMFHIPSKFSLDRWELVAGILQ